MSSTLLDAHQVTRRHAARTVLDSVDVRVNVGARIGVIGPNGAGKSTLLRILAGCERPDGGFVRRFGSVGYMPQAIDTNDPRLTVRELILERVGVAAAARDLEAWGSALAAGDLSAIEPHAAALERWLALGGNDVAARISAALLDLGLDHGFLDRRLETLSGGQASRAGLAAIAVARFDVMLLDEPTNHLDDDGLIRLGALLSACSGAIVLVSHDRTLLTGAVEEILELDARTGQASRFGGGWAAFERERGAARARARAEHEQALARRAQLVAAERETRRRGAASVKRARARVHDNDKHSREWVTMRAEAMAARARKMGGRGQRIDIPERPWEQPGLALELTAAERRRPWVVELDGFVARRGGWSLGPIDLVVAHGDRVLLSGPNGSGKSTLLAALAGAIRPAEGRRRAAPGVPIAQLSQTEDRIYGDRTPVRYLRTLTGLDDQRARTALASFGLRAEVANRQLSTLSPGERTQSPTSGLCACSSMSRPTISTSNLSRCSRRHYRAGPGRSSSPPTTVACVESYGSSEYSRFRRRRRACGFPGLLKNVRAHPCFASPGEVIVRAHIAEPPRNRTAVDGEPKSLGRISRCSGCSGH